MFAYCNNNPVVYSDSEGGAPGICMISFGNNTKKYDPVSDATQKAIAIGENASLAKGHIFIDMSTCGDEILEISEHLSIREISDLIAFAACDVYCEQYFVEFLLSDLCVSREIEDHIDAYFWATGHRSVPNYLAAGYVALNFSDNFYSTDGVYRATVHIDMRENDVIANGGVTSQAFLFGYKNGIRDIYVGTPRDPWASSR